MNCENFETIVNELARVNVMDAAMRARALAHTETCERCAARLADEGALTAGLSALSACGERKAEPDNIEAALVEAFRTQASSPIARRLPVQAQLWPRWAFAAAAAILIACGFLVYRTTQTELRKNNNAITAMTPTPQPSLKREEQIAHSTVESESSHSLRALRLHRGNQPRPSAPIVPQTVIADAKDSEDATDFILLRYGDDHKPMESGEVIRVQMSRSSLITLGLPVDVERADEPVKVDLLIGEDGLARAIRFVR